MDTRTALKIALTAIDKEIQRYAVDGNLYDAVGARYQAAITANNKRKELKEAKVIITTMLTANQLTMDPRDENKADR